MTEFPYSLSGIDFDSSTGFVTGRAKGLEQEETTRHTVTQKVIRHTNKLGL